MAYEPTGGMKEEAQRGLDWRREFGRGGTEVGIARARDIVNGKNLSLDTVKRMRSFFARHRVDKEAEGFSPGEEGYPSNGRIAWALWGGDAGDDWAEDIVEDVEDEEDEDDDMSDRAAPDALKLGDFVEWNSSGGMARGQIEHIMREGTLGIPDSEFSINATPEDPAALIRIFRDGEATDTLVGHRFSTLTKIKPIRAAGERPYANEHAARIKDPRQYDSFRRRNNGGGRGVDYIFGIKDGTSEIQAIRFRTQFYTVAEARAWLKRNNFEPIEFEPATEEARSMQDGGEFDMIAREMEDSAMQDEEHIEPTEVQEEPELEEVRYSREGIETRAMAFEDQVIDTDARRVKIAVSSEEPVERSFGIEILDHKPGSIDLSFLNSGRAPLLLDHDPTKQIGVVESVTLDGSARRLRATARFGKNGLAKEVFDDVTDGIRANISVGYQINKLDKEGKETYRATSWMPMEVSIVSIPADRTVGVGRSAADDLTTSIPATPIKEAKMAEFDLEAVKAEAARAAAKDAAEMIRLGASHNKRDLADKAIANGRSLAEFRGELLEAIGNKPLDTSTDIGLSQKEVRKFSLMAAIRAMANPTDFRAQEEARFEFEASAAAQRAIGADAKGLLIPTDVLRSWAKRDLNTTDDSGVIAQDFRGGDFIDVLRNASSVMQAGATMLTGLKGNVAIPKKTAGSSAGWISTEGGAASESEPTFGQVTMTPKTLGAFTDITRLMMMQSSPDIEALVRDDLSRAIALAIDLGALSGSGSSGQPTGIKNVSGVNKPTSFAAATPTFAEVVALETAVAEDNALLGNLAYILPAGMYGALKTTAKASGQGLFVVEQPGNTINGYRAIVSNQVTSGDLFFGNFADLLIGMYGGLDILVDPYTASSSGTVRVRALQTVDVAVRHAVSFAYNNDGV
jgi:HK97 family phage major capsid protein